MTAKIRVTVKPSKSNSNAVFLSDYRRYDIILTMRWLYRHCTRTRAKVRKTSFCRKLCWWATSSMSTFCSCSESVWTTILSLSSLNWWRVATFYRIWELRDRLWWAQNTLTCSAEVEWVAEQGICNINVIWWAILVTRVGDTMDRCLHLCRSLARLLVMLTFIPFNPQYH